MPATLPLTPPATSLAAVGTRSLRARLVLVILPPLLVIAAAAGLWQLSNARATAAEVHDRRLLLTALAVSYDVALSGGETLSARTRALLSGEAPLFYHVYAPDGAIVTGYATPPVGIPRLTDPAAPTFFDAAYQGRPVRGVRVRAQGEIDAISGVITTTVWQDAAGRRALVKTLMGRTLAVIALLTACAAAVVWLGVRRGLRPLADIEAAIALRSGEDLSPIRRPVPPEVSGIVARLNALFGQVSRVMGAQAAFVGNAAHQLRNPIAGMLALAEAVERAPDAAAARARAADLGDAAREAARLAEALLLLERASADLPDPRREACDLAALLRSRAAALDPPPGVAVAVEAPAPVPVLCDPVLMGEAIANLLDNALRHGGPGLSRVVARAEALGGAADGGARLRVSDDGRGVAPGLLPTLTERFRQAVPGTGAGLGLAIAEAVVEGHGGTLRLRSGAAPEGTDAGGGLSVEIVLPRVAPGPRPAASGKTSQPSALPSRSRLWHLGGGEG